MSRLAALVVAICACSISLSAQEPKFVYRDTTDCSVWVLHVLYAPWEPVIVSPDGKRSVQMVPGGRYKEFQSARPLTFRVYEGKELLDKIEVDYVGARMIVKWAPDSSAFLLDWSDTGYSGIYHVRVFRIEGRRVLEVPSAQNAGKFDNLSHVRWIGADELMLWTNKDTMGCPKCTPDWAAYRVRVTDGKVLERFGRKRARPAAGQCPKAMMPKELRAAFEATQKF